MIVFSFAIIQGDCAAGFRLYGEDKINFDLAGKYIMALTN